MSHGKTIVIDLFVHRRKLGCTDHVNDFASTPPSTGGFPSPWTPSAFVAFCDVVKQCFTTLGGLQMLQAPFPAAGCDVHFVLGATPTASHSPPYSTTLTHLYKSLGDILVGNVQLGRSQKGSGKQPICIVIRMSIEHR